LGWNCEHLARLAATGEAKCYPIGVFAFLGDGINHDANRILRDKLAEAEGRVG